MAGISISPEDFDLEAKRREDGSWHPCRISLSDDNLDIVVHFERNADKDIISDEKDALLRLRYRSVPLESGECANIEQGECVLAMHRGQSRSLFFDAVIKEPRRVKHSKRVNCRCLFEIEWLSPEMEENTTTVSSNSIRKLSKKSITSHSVLDAFLNSLNPATSANGSPPRSLLDETIWGLVQKIEETSKCTEKSTEWADDNFLKAKRGKLSGDALKIVTKGPQSSRRSTRSQIKQEVRMEISTHSEDKPFISPLAACAALASYIHESSPKHGILVSHLLMKSDASTQDNMSVVSNPTQNTYYSPVNTNGSRSSPSNRRGTEKSQSSDSQVSRITRTSVQKEKIESTAEVAQGSSNTKQNGPMNATRLTRSTKRNEARDPSIQQELGKRKLTETLKDVSVGDFATPEKSESKKKPTSSLEGTRLTRSTKRNEARDPSIQQELGKRKLTETLKDVSVGDFATPEKSESKKKPTSSLVDSDTVLTFHTKRSTRSSIIITTEVEGPGEIMQKKENSQAVKTKTVSSKKPKTRFSPRLRFLPRTRSQKDSRAC